MIQWEFDHLPHHNTHFYTLTLLTVILRLHFRCAIGHQVHVWPVPVFVFHISNMSHPRRKLASFPHLCWTLRMKQLSNIHEMHKQVHFIHASIVSSHGICLGIFKKNHIPCVVFVAFINAAATATARARERSRSVYQHNEINTPACIALNHFSHATPIGGFSTIFSLLGGFVVLLALFPSSDLEPAFYKKNQTFSTARQKQFKCSASKNLIRPQSNMINGHCFGLART